MTRLALAIIHLGNVYTPVGCMIDGRLMVNNAVMPRVTDG